jgi:molybdate transport system ATP-binding protein
MGLEVAFQADIGADGVSIAFEAPAAGVTALFGESGAGKSTVLNVTAGLLKPRSGRVIVGGRVLLDTQSGVNVPPEQRRIGYVFQDGRLFPHLSVRRNLEYGARRSAGGLAENRLADIVGLLGIELLLERKPGSLSGGEKQRVAIGRALLSNPELLLLDEPLAALDAARKHEIIPYLDALRAAFSVPILLVTHDYRELLRLADWLVLLERGRVIDQGKLGDVLARTPLRALGGDVLSTILDGVVAGHEDAPAFSRVEVAGFLFRVPRLEAPVGAAARLAIGASDVVLVVGAVGQTSASNQLAGVIEALRPEADGSLIATVVCGGVRLAVRLLQTSADRLALSPGSQVTALIKGVRLERVGY